MGVQSTKLRTLVSPTKRAEFVPFSVAALLAHAASRLSRLLGHAGAVIGGKVLLALRPNAIEELASEKEIVLVSGTNGKTTTTLFLTNSLATKIPVASNSSGANLFSGISYALLCAKSVNTIVLEADEGVLSILLPKLKPRFVLLMNLSRDQLDRYGDMRIIASRLKTAVADLTQTQIIANASDPYIAWIAEGLSNCQWVDTGKLNWNRDQLLCPRCGQLLKWEEDDWSCSCGFEKPLATVKVQENGIEVDGKSHRLRMKLPGKFQYSNAAFALACAKNFRVNIDEAMRSFRYIKEVQGRFRLRKVANVEVQLFLAKNPAGWSETLELIGQRHDPVFLVVNSQVADGKDVSWLWDIDFSNLANRPVVVAGERATEVAARLLYSGIKSDVYNGDLLKLVRSFPDGHIDVIANYTSFRQLSGRIK